MKSAVETLNPTRVKLTVEVPFDELKPSVDRAYKTIGSQVQVPGFRKGHVPPRIIDQRVGRGAVLEEAVNEALPHFFAQAMEAGQLRPLGRPTVDVTEVPDPTGNGDLKFTIEVDVRPKIQLPDLAGLEVSVDDAVVSEEDVDARLASLRERFGTLNGVDRAVENGDFLSIDLRAEIDGEEIDSVKGVSYQVGSGTMLPGMDEAVLGLSAGETTTFSAPLAGGEHAGKEALVTVTVQAVKVRDLPRLDDDFAQLASEFDTLEELRDDLREKAGTDKRFEQGVQARERLLTQLIDSVDIPLPEGLIAEEVTRHLEGEDRAQDDEHRTQVEADTRTALRNQLLLDAIAESEGISVNQQELIEYLVLTARQYGMDPNDFAKAIDQAGEVPAMVQEVARRKALVVVLARATIKDASGNEVDLDLNIPDDAAGQAGQADEPGEPGEPGAEPEAVELPVPTGPATADPTALPAFDLAGFEPDDAPAVASATAPEQAPAADAAAGGGSQAKPVE